MELLVFYAALGLISLLAIVLRWKVLRRYWERDETRSTDLIQALIVLLLLIVVGAVMATNGVTIWGIVLYSMLLAYFFLGIGGRT
jgi:hypothetical protein